MDWNAFWKWASESGFWGNFLATLAAALVIGFVPKLREAVWKAITKTWAFIISIRLTTTRGIESVKKEAFEAGADSFVKAIAPTGDKTTTLKGLLLDNATANRVAGVPEPEQVEKVAPTVGDDIRDEDPIHTKSFLSNKKPIDAMSAGLLAISKATQPILESVTQPPPLQEQPLAEWSLTYAPTIRIGSGDKAWVFRLKNLADDVAPRRVRVEPKDDRLAFPDGAFWNQVEPLETKSFSGIQGTGGSGKGPLVCKVSWVEDGQVFSRDVSTGFKLV